MITILYMQQFLYMKATGHMVRTLASSPYPNALVTASSSMWAVKLCSTKSSCS